MKKLIYSCLFFNMDYLKLLKLLLRSFSLFGNASDDIDYLINMKETITEFAKNTPL